MYQNIAALNEIAVIDPPKLRVVGIVADVSPDMPMFTEETFGPAAAVITAANGGEAVLLANASRYGLGNGRELSHFGIREFVNPQTVWMGPPARV